MEDIEKTLQTAIEDTEKKLNALVDPLIKRLEKNEPITEELKKELNQYQADNKKAIDDLLTNYKELQKQYDVLDMNLQKGKADMPYSIEKHLNEKIIQQDFQHYIKANKKTNHFTLDLSGMDMKDAGNVVRVADTIQPQFTGIQYLPSRRFHVRDIIPTGTTTSSTIWMPYMTDTTNSIARVAEGGVKVLSDFTPAVVKWNVEKIATSIRFSEEILEDMPGFVSYITTRWMELLKQAEDIKLLYGTGSSDIKGLTVSGAAYVDIFADAKVTMYDVLDGAATQIKTANFTPDYILLHPTDALKLRSVKDTTGNYIFPPHMGGVPMQIGGAVIIETPSMTSGDFLVGDFGMGCQLFDRKAASITFYDQDGDNARYNLITAVIEERLALVTYQSTAFVFGVFASALARGSA